MQDSKYTAISGATGGLGATVALTLAKSGSALLLGGRDLNKLEKLAKKIVSTYNTPVAFAYLDVTSQNSVEDFFRFHEGQLVGFVHTAAIIGAKGPVAETEPAEWRETLETNLVGTYLCLRMATLSMAPFREGSIVALSGGGASGPLKTLSAYAVSKVGVVRLVETLAEEISGSGIRINAVAPGVLPTDMNHDLLQRSKNSLVDQDYLTDLEDKLSLAGDSLQNASDLIEFLLDTEIEGLTGRLISAVWDDWRDWASRPPDLDSKDLYRIRRQIAP